MVSRALPLGFTSHTSRLINRDALSIYGQSRNISLRDLKAKMQGISKVEKITASMRSIAVAKIKNVERNNMRARPFYQTSEQVMQPESYQAGVSQPTSTSATSTHEPPHLFIICTSDKGMCGPMNSTIVRTALKHIDTEFKGKKVNLIVLGQKGINATTRTNATRMVATAGGFDQFPVSFADVSPIADAIASTDWSSITLYYTKFLNLTRVEPATRAIRPVAQLLNANWSRLNFEDEEVKEIVTDYHSFNVASVLYTSMVENAHSEMGARFTSMEAASKSAREILVKLNLKYNKQRQSAITTELIEIISGAESLKAAVAEQTLI